MLKQLFLLFCLVESSQQCIAAGSSTICLINAPTDELACCEGAVCNLALRCVNAITTTTSTTATTPTTSTTPPLNCLERNEGCNITHHTPNNCCSGLECIKKPCNPSNLLRSGEFCLNVGGKPFFCIDVSGKRQCHTGHCLPAGTL